MVNDEVRKERPVVLPSFGHTSFIRHSPFGFRNLRSLLEFNQYDETCGARQLALHLAQILLRLQCRGATHSRSGNSLFVNAVSHVAGDENTGNFTFYPVFR